MAQQYTPISSGANAVTEAASPCLEAEPVPLGSNQQYQVLSLPQRTDIDAFFQFSLQVDNIGIGGTLSVKLDSDTKVYDFQKIADSDNKFGFSFQCLRVTASDKNSTRNGGVIRECRDTKLVEKAKQVINDSLDKLHALKVAMVDSKTKEIAALLKEGVNPNIKLCSGKSLLQYAAECGNAISLRLLLKYKAEVNSTDKYGWTPLRFAAEHGHLECCQLLIQAGAIIQHSSNEHQILMSLAIKHRHCELIKELSQHQVDMNQLTAKGELYIIQAINTHDLDTVDTVIKCGARSTEFDRQCNYPLMVALSNSNSEIVDLLLHQSLDAYTKSQNATKQNAIRMAIKYCHHFALPCLQAHAQLIAINELDPNGKSPLFRVVEYGITDKVRYLVLAGASTDTQCKGKKNPLETPLMRAASLNNKPEILDILLGAKQSPELNIQDAKGNTALHYAARSAPCNISTLLSHGAQLDIKNERSQTPLHLYMEYIANQPSEIDPLKEPLLTLLNQPTTFLNKQDKKGHTALNVFMDHINENLSSIIENKQDKLKAIARLAMMFVGSDVDLMFDITIKAEFTEDIKCKSMLQFAVYYQLEDLAKAIIDKQPHLLTVFCTSGTSAIELALANGCSDELLIAIKNAGASLKVQNASGQTVLQQACMAKRYQFVIALCSGNTRQTKELMRSDPDGFTPLHYAIMYLPKEIAALELAHENRDKSIYQNAIKTLLDNTAKADLNDHNHPIKLAIITGNAVGLKVLTESSSATSYIKGHSVELIMMAREQLNAQTYFVVCSACKPYIPQYMQRGVPSNEKAAVIALKSHHDEKVKQYLESLATGALAFPSISTQQAQVLATKFQSLTEASIQEEIPITDSKPNLTVLDETDDESFADISLSSIEGENSET